MPSFPCAGGCPRLISVSAVPGGNPVALADPEGFACVYLQCRACKAYFCDRCLGRGGKGMAETTCPACKGQLFDPRPPAPAAKGAGSPAPPAAPAGAAAVAAALQGLPQLGNYPANRDRSGGLRIEIEGRFRTWLDKDGENGAPFLTRVVIPGAQLALPAICACCARPSDATHNVSDRQEVSRVGNQVTYKELKLAVPSCKACLAHAAAASKARSAQWRERAAASMGGVDCACMGLLPVFGGALFFVLGSMLVGRSFQRGPGGLCVSITVTILAAIAGGLVTYVMRQNAKAKAKAEGEKALAELGPLLSPTCCRKDGDPLQMFISAEGTTFVLHSKVFAAAFLLANRAHVTS